MAGRRLPPTGLPAKRAQGIAYAAEVLISHGSSQDFANHLPHVEPPAESDLLSRQPCSNRSHRLNPITAAAQVMHRQQSLLNCSDPSRGIMDTAVPIDA
eukprot:2756757-Amphidinium_carterae.1